MLRRLSKHLNYSSAAIGSMGKSHRLVFPVYHATAAVCHGTTPATATATATAPAPAPASAPAATTTTTATTTD